MIICPFQYVTNIQNQKQFFSIINQGIQEDVLPDAEDFKKVEKNNNNNNK